MKIVLAFPPFYLASMYNLAPLGLINLATALGDTDHRVSIMDFVLEIRQGVLPLGRGIYDACARRILQQDPDLVGLSAQCTTYPAVLNISRKIKAMRPDVKIVVGGHNAAFTDRRTLERSPAVDAVVRGEGESTFRELVDAYDRGRDEEGVAGTTFRRGRDIVRNADRDLIPDLDRLPLPDYGLLPPLAVYRDACGIPRSIAILEVGRGCPHRCIYCSESILWRRTTRTFSVSRIVEEMENLHRNHGAECFLLAYDQFTARRGFVEAFCRSVIERGLNRLPWYCISRLDGVDAALLALMREAGCESMCYGIDSGSEKTLAFIRKNIDQDILYRRVVETADQGIIPTLSFVIGFPEEEKEDIDQTLALALRAGIVGNNNPLIQMPTVLPGTDLHERYGSRLLRAVDTYFALGLEFDGPRRLPEDEALIDSDPLLFSSFYNLPCRARPLEELSHIAGHFPLIVRFYPKTFLLLSLETGSSISDLFVRWLDWVRDRTGREEITLSPQDCYLHFGNFVAHALSGREDLRFGHLRDMLKYEEKAIEVGKFPGPERPFHVDLHKIREFTPLRSQGVVIDAFEFDLPVIILDLKCGICTERYAPRRTILLFKQSGDRLEVLEIDPFVAELLRLCDGTETLEAISQRLYERHPQDMSAQQFFTACAEALQVLGSKGCLG